MTEDKFFLRIGKFHEMADAACDKCVVSHFNKEGHAVQCDSGCAVAIRDVYRCIKGCPIDINVGDKEE